MKQDPPERAETLYYFALEKEGEVYVESTSLFSGEERPKVPEMESYLSRHHQPVRAKVRLGHTIVETVVYRALDDSDCHFTVCNIDGQPSGTPAMAPPDPGRLSLQRYFSSLRDSLDATESVLPEQRWSVLHNFMQPNLVEKNDYHGAKEYRLPWSRALRYDKVVVVGHAGCGKTTLLRRFALELAGQDAPEQIPIYVQLRKWSAQGSLLEFIRSALLEGNALDAAKELEQLGDSGSVVLLLDGVDEILDQDRRNAVTELQKLADRFSSCRIVLSTRYPSHARHFAGFRQWFVQPLTKNQVAEFALHQLRDDRLWHSFSERLHSERGVGEISSNPLVLSAVLARYSRTETSPLHITDVLRSSTEMLLDEWDSVRGIRRSSQPWLSLSQRLFALQWLARELVTTDRERISREKVLRIADKMSGSFTSESLLSFLEEENGLLTSAGDGYWKFVHSSYKDYLASLFFVEKLSSVEENLESSIRGSSGKARRVWERIWRFVCGLTSDANEPLRSVIEKTPHDYSAQDGLLVARALSQRLSVDRDVIDGSCRFLVEVLRKHIDGFHLDGSQSTVDDNKSTETTLLLSAGDSGNGPREFAELLRLTAGIRGMRDGSCADELCAHLDTSQDSRLQRLSALVSSEGKLMVHREKRGRMRVIRIEVVRPEAERRPQAEARPSQGQNTGRIN